MQNANTEATKKKQQQSLANLLTSLLRKTTGSFPRNCLLFRIAQVQFGGTAIVCSLLEHCWIQEESWTLTTAPKEGLSLPAVGHSGHSLGAMPKGFGRAFVSTQKFGEQKAKGRGRGAERQVPARVLRHTHTRLGKPEPSSSACQQTRLHLSTSCCNYPAAAAPKHLSETVGTTHTPS